MSWIVRVVGPSGAESYIALRLVDREAADKFEHADKALAMAVAVHAALGCYADAIDPQDPERTAEDAINAHAHAMQKRDQMARLEGRPEHDLDTRGAPLKPAR